MRGSQLSGLHGNLTDSIAWCIHCVLCSGRCAMSAFLNMVTSSRLTAKNCFRRFRVEQIARPYHQKIFCVKGGAMHKYCP